MQPNRLHSDSGAFRDPECGQASVLLLLMLSTFLLGLMAFAVDLTALWFHRQTIQSAADSACLAGASDMLALQAGVTPPGTGFSPGTAGNCVSSPTAPLCKYAGFNGYNGAGLTNADGANSVAWKFPSTVPGVTKPTQLSYPFLNVAITENVKTYFAGFLHGSRYQPVSASATCAIAYVKEAPPIAILSPNASGALSYSGGAALNIIGGPSRSVQVNSSSPTGILYHASAIIDLSKGGPNHSGSDVAVYGGPAAFPTGGYSGGTSGSWSGHDLPVADPFASVPPPTSVKSLVPASTVNGTPVSNDGCPDTTCTEFSSGYYPSGITLGGTTTAIFKPGIYYMNGSLTSGHSATLRMAKPSGYKQTDGVMFYFFSGGLNISGCSGCVNSLKPVSRTDLTCDGSDPDPALNMPLTLYGNVLWGQCTANGTYWDNGNDTTDSQGNPGSRGMLVFSDHNNTSPAVYGGSGALVFSGTLYLHSNTYATVLNLSGGTSTGTFVLGNIIADQISLTGSGKINLALNPAKTIQIAKVALVQ